MEMLQERMRQMVGKTCLCGATIGIIEKRRLKSPNRIRKYLSDIQLKARKRPPRESIAFVRLQEEYEKAVYKELMRETLATIRYLNKQNNKPLYNYFESAYPEAYGKEEAKLEKSEASDKKQIDKYFEGWEDTVKPEKMEEVMAYYNEKAANLGGQKALNDMGVKIAFNLKDPAILAEIQNRGEKITGVVSETTLQDFKDAMYKTYLDGGMSPYDLKKEVTSVFGEKFTDEYRGRAMTIARTESGIAHATVQNEAYQKNGAKKKTWVATVDALTRESHVEVNGEEVDFDEPFSNGLMFPLESNAPPEEVINCRCDFIVTEFDENFCQGDGKDTADCTMPWTGEEGEPQQEEAPDHDVEFANLYAKPLDEGGLGVMNMMKMSEGELVKLEVLLEKGQMDKAYSLLGKYSGRKAETIKNMSASSYKKATDAYKKCKGL